VLTMIIGSSTYSFSLVVALFLIGLAGGAWFIGRKDRAPHLRGLLLTIELVTALSLVFSLFVLNRIPALLIDLGLLGTAWPVGPARAMMWPAGLGGFPKMMMANLALYGYLVIKPLDGIGYDLMPKKEDFKVGLREFLYYAPIVLVLGFAMGFIGWQGRQAHVEQFPAAWVFTFCFVALPEELFFRGLIQNLLERKMGRTAALLLASLLFGLSHFNKRAVFNWRYVILATIAGIFYGRAWRAQRRLFASSITHTTVDAVWSIWWR